MDYTPPTLTIHGSVERLTAAGNDPCRFDPDRGYKQSGAKDLVLGQASLQTCTPTSSVT